MRDAALLLVAAVLAAASMGCGSGPAESTRTSSTTAARPAYDYPEQGYSVTIPDGWQRAERRLTVLVDPLEVLVAGTYRPRQGGEDCGPLVFGGFDADEALVIVLERGRAPAAHWKGFPPRPAQFAYEPGMESEFTECLRDTGGIPLRDHWFTFTDAGRHFHVLVAIGADAPPEAAGEAYRMLDSLRFDPSVKPDWRSGE